MGFNTTVVIYNETLGEIAKDSRFGAKIEQAAGRMRVSGATVRVPSGRFSNAAMVVESHHADSTALITVGGNFGVRHMLAGGLAHSKDETPVLLLERWAAKLGYSLVKNA